MDPSPMIIGRKFLLFLSFFSFLTMWIGVWFKITHFSIGPITANIMLTVAIVPGMFAWLMVFYDIIKHSFRNSLLWIIGMFCFGSVVTILYLSSRDRLVAEVPRF